MCLRQVCEIFSLPPLFLSLFLSLTLSLYLRGSLGGGSGWEVRLGGIRYAPECQVREGMYALECQVVDSVMRCHIKTSLVPQCHITSRTLINQGGRAA